MFHIEVAITTLCRQFGAKSSPLGLQMHTDPNDPTLKLFVKKMAVIAFCPPSFVHPAWLAVQQEAPHFQQWNYFDLDGPRTNNHDEGWHSRLKKVVEKPHPNIFELIEVIKKEEATTRMKMSLNESGAK